MALEITGGGKGYIAGVSSENRLFTSTVQSSIEHHVNHTEGLAFNIVFSQSPTAADDCIFYMLNSDDKDMCVEGITLGVTDCTADETLYFKVGDSGTRNGANTVTPVNLNAGSGNNADGTFEYGADLDGGSATLAGGSEFKRLVFAGVTDSSSKYYNFESDLILPKNRALTIWVGGSAAGTYYITVHMNYHAKEE